MTGRDAAAWTCPTLLLLVGLAASAWLGLQPRPLRPVAAVFPPWWGLARAYAAAASAGGAVLRSGAWSSLLVTASVDRDFAARLHAAGAWLVLDPQGLGTCGGAAEGRR